ncbi:MAG TPA: GntR family transcriptional regulator, partial [Marmoricola sp.]
SGELGPGDRLPSARPLADSLDVNMHTVLRAYGALRDEGLIELRRGRGAQVRAGAAHELSGHAELRSQIDELVRQATRLGVTREQLLDRVGRAMS